MIAGRRHGPSDQIQKHYLQTFYQRGKEIIEFMFDHGQKGRKYFINICDLHDFFPYSFHVILALDEVMVEVISFGNCRSF